MPEQFEQLDELLVALGASVGRHEVVDLAVGRWLFTTRKRTQRDRRRLDDKTEAVIRELEAQHKEAIVGAISPGKKSQRRKPRGGGRRREGQRDAVHAVA